MSDSTLAASKPIEPSSRDDRFPSGIPYIVGNEAAERFSFYGMRQILYVYLVGLFSNFVTENLVPEAAKVHATQIAHLFFASAYLFPLIGAILADRVLGKYRVIFWVSLFYVAGHGALAIAGRAGALGHIEPAKAAMFAGLFLIALGSGGIKPCVSANVGDQFGPRNAHLVPRIFQIFYFTVNFGSFFASLLTPWLYVHVSPEVAFGVPGILMALAAFVFWLGRNRFIRIPPQPGGKLGLLDFVASSLMTMPLLVGLYVTMQVSEPLINSLIEHGMGAFGHALGEVIAQYGWVVLGAVACFLAGGWVAHRRQQIKQDTGFVAILLYCFQRRRSRSPDEDFWAPARKQFGETVADGPPAVLRIIVVFSMVSVFWALFEQYSSTWVQQARAMALVFNVPTLFWYDWFVPAALAAVLAGGVMLFLWIANRPVTKKVALTVVGALAVWGVIVTGLQISRGGFSEITLLPAQISAVNPLFVMLIIPLLNFGVYMPLERRGKPLSPLRRMTIGMFVAGFSFAAVALIQMRIDAIGPGKVSVLWQLIPYFIITTAEVLVSVTGLEFAYTQAPRAMKSTIMGFWLLCVTAGDALVAFLAPLQVLSLATFFWTFAGLMALAATAFAALAARYRGRTYLQE
ncbi:MAG TPA: MFS transporter [Opitutaceae bacterium]